MGRVVCAGDRWVDAGGMPVTDGGGRVKADNNGLLSIVSAQQVDAGNYTCLASNLAAVVQRTVSLVVSGTYPCSLCILYFLLLY